MKISVALVVFAPVCLAVFAVDAEPTETGGRINQETLMYQAEAPALHLGLSLGFFALSDIDCAVSVAPVIRLYNLRTKTWDFSRSYAILSFALKFKSYALVEQHQWSESITTANTLGGSL